MLKIFFSFTLLLCLFVGSAFFFVSGKKPLAHPEEEPDAPVFESAPSEPLPPIIYDEPEPEILEPVATNLTKAISYAVPFTSQAPTGDWSRSEFQDGCEEASIIMVNAWRKGEILTRDGVKQELVALARYQEKQIDHGVDTNAADTAEILLGQYFSITDYMVRYDFSIDELKQVLIDGVIIVPTNGRLLGNPNFTLPGPLQHMVVIVGYDPVTEEFITNDPGTRKGEGYRYDDEILYNAIREYPTGKHLPIKTERKAMIVIPTLSGT